MFSFRSSSLETVASSALLLGIRAELAIKMAQTAARITPISIGGLQSVSTLLRKKPHI